MKRTILWIVEDVKDEYRKVTFSKKAAFLDAINHCVTEGLTVTDYQDQICEGLMYIEYIDPDDKMREYITITPKFI